MILPSVSSTQEYLPSLFLLYWLYSLIILKALCVSLSSSVFSFSPSQKSLSLTFLLEAVFVSFLSSLPPFQKSSSVLVVCFFATAFFSASFVSFSFSSSHFFSLASCASYCG